MATNDLNMEAGAMLASEVAAFIRSRKPMFWIKSVEETRVERGLLDAASVANFRLLFWDIARGVREYDGSIATLHANVGDPIVLDEKVVRPGQPQAILTLIEAERQRAVTAARAHVAAQKTTPIKGLERIVWILRDYDPYLKDPSVRRMLRNLAGSMKDTVREGAHAIVLISTSDEIPPDLADSVAVIKWTLPDRAELGRILDGAINGLPVAKRAEAAPNGVREAAIEAAVGLTEEGALTIYRKSFILRDGKIDPTLVATEKKRVVNSAKGVEWHDPDPRGLDAIGGLDNVKAWLVSRKDAFSEEARAFGLSAPKGMIFVGVPGCGKSLTAKAVAAAWKCPLLQLDLGAVKGGIVGQSERQIREALALAETIGRCVLWIDEIEKALAGAMGGGNDSGVSTGILGTFLSWMQERKSPVFVIATANDVSALPPELLRKGRFDAVWFADVPTLSERVEILRVALKRVERTLPDKDLRWVAGQCDGFAGVEVAELVPEALTIAFADGKRSLTADDLVACAQSTVPLTRTAEVKIKALRAWAAGNARPASRPEVATPVGPTGPSDLGNLDLDSN